MPGKTSEKENYQKNLKLYYGAVGVIILGYVFLSIGGADSLTSLTIGPVVLVVGYIVAMPIALLAGLGEKKEGGESSFETKTELKTRNRLRKK